MSMSSSNSSNTRFSALAGLTAVAMTFGALLPGSSANAAGLAFGAFSAYSNVAADGEGSVLDLEGDDEAAAAALTTALRREFAARGVGGGKEMSALELKLTMGCDEPPAPACMAEGGRTMGLHQMVYGTVVKMGDGFTVKLTLLDVDGVAVQSSLSAPLSADAFISGVVEGTAKDLVDQMLGAEPEPVEPIEVVEPSEPMPVYDEPVQDDGGGLVWGRHDAARWKKVGLATSAVLTVAAVGAGVAMGLMTREGGLVHKELIDAAKASLDDNKAANDVDPYSDQNLCDVANTPLPTMDGGQGVTNKAVADVCQKGDTFATVATASFVGAGVFGVSTIVFTTLLFVHRDKTDGVAAKMRTHQAAVGISPTRDGGAMVGGRWRF